MSKKVGFLLTAMLMVGCGGMGDHGHGDRDDKDGGSSGSSFKMLASRFAGGSQQSYGLKDSFLFASSSDFHPFATTGSVSLTNLSGLANSVIFFLDGQNDCGFVPWAAEGVDGPVAAADDKFEAFDLKNPDLWEGRKTGWAPHCQNGSASRFGMFAAYWDLTLSVDGSEKVVRVAFGDYGSYKKGDALIKVGDTFHWASTDGSTLTPETSARPTSVAQISPIASASYYTDQEGHQMSLVNIGVTITDDEGIASPISLSFTEFKTMEIDFNLDNTDIVISDTSSNGKILSSLDASFLDFASGGLRAKVTMKSSDDNEIKSDDGVDDIDSPSAVSFTYSGVTYSASIPAGTEAGLDSLKTIVASYLTTNSIVADLNMGKMHVSVGGTELTAANFSSTMAGLTSAPTFAVTLDP